MRRSQLIITALLLVLLLIAGFATRLPVNYGAVPWFGWVGLAVFVTLMGVTLVLYDTIRRRARVLAAIAVARAAAQMAEAEKATTKPVPIDPEGPPYPHPRITALT